MTTTVHLLNVCHYYTSLVITTVIHSGGCFKTCSAAADLGDLAIGDLKALIMIKTVHG